MLEAIRDFFHEVLAEPERRERHHLTLELATAALLCEVMRADYEQTEAERSALEQMLMTRYRLDGAQVAELMALAEAEVEQAVDHYQFVRLINDHYDYAKRCELVALMWRLAWADGTVDPLEEHRIRRLADLLYVGHGDFIRAKLEAEKHRDA
ncbi:MULTISPECIES: TerB family tellurite resistance protein [unclassified Halomonas]|uniref:tellurite resistance TerB family protein n=1 Tax=unclassified Halomonas TaxID=2609666 RepID=UPI0020A0ABD6|nr:MULTISPECIES: TerB family tellurite resistance protein [unclassified Halomonas]MCP1315201.1 TerB family tellurite resistance protein [Halomonas sp. 707D7]MCP1327703.1 TerB family tellurite resistance protein [Halomonas sp. 707D4]